MSLSERLIYVAPVPRVSAQGRRDYTMEVGTVSVPTPVSRAKGTDIPLKFVRNTAGTMLITGMDEDIENPYFGKDWGNLSNREKPGPDWLLHYDKLIKPKQRITKQLYYEFLDKVPINHYTALCNMPTMAVAYFDKQALEARPTFLEKFSYYLNSRDLNVISNKTTRGRLGQLVVLNHPKVAPDHKSMNQDIHEFYITHADEAIKKVNQDIDYLMDGAAALRAVVKEYPSNTQYKFAVILKIVEGLEVTSDTVEYNLKTYVTKGEKTKHGTQIQRIDNFLNLYKTLKEDKDRFDIKYLVRQAVNSNVLIFSSGQFIWPSKRGYDNLYKLGTSEKAVVNMFLREYLVYQPELEDGDNIYGDFLNELKAKNVRLD